MTEDEKSGWRLVKDYTSIDNAHNSPSLSQSNQDSIFNSIYLAIGIILKSVPLFVRPRPCLR